jgi:dethiobiotin synthetase
VRHKFIFVTGTDTGAGKTVLTSLLVRSLRSAGIDAAALKPVCSGGRDDARLLLNAQQNDLSLDEINPWHFRAALSPLLAARRENRRVRRAELIDQVRGIQRRHPIVIVEGAGGLMSPMGEDFDSRDLIAALGAIPLVVCPNRLGAINQVLLVLEALPRRATERAQVVLIAPPVRDPAGRGNVELLQSRLGPRVHALPWIRRPADLEHALSRSGVARAIQAVMDALAEA